MEAMDDMRLLREYAANNSEAAFEELVTRRVGLVYAAALRQVGDPLLAEEVTQAVFIILAQKAGKLSEKTVLIGWLFKTTRFAALAQIRSAARNCARQTAIEKELQMQTEFQSAADAETWQKISPLLDGALAGLGEKDRQAVLLRFFENKSLAEVGETLGAGEDTARKRVSRALEKLRKYFFKRDVHSTTAVIARMIAANSVQGAPSVLAKSISAIAVAKGAAASASTLTVITGALKIMAWTNTKIAVVAGLGLLLIAGTAEVTVSSAKKIETRKETEWRFLGIQPFQVDKASPQVTILPTKFPGAEFALESGRDFNKFVGINVPLEAIASKAYDVPRGRIRFPVAPPQKLYDFVATLPQGSAEALQRELKRRLGYVGRVETVETNALVLTVARGNASGLKPPISGKPDDYWNPGHFECFDQPIFAQHAPFQGLARFLEIYFGMPVIDQTGLSQHFSIDLRWREQPGRQELNRASLKQAMLDQLGLQLDSTNASIEILQVERVK